jgi:hypothetical protein
MARFVTLLSMRTAIQIRGSYENSLDITVPILNDFINEACAEVWDILKSKRDDRLVVAVTLTTVPGQDFIDLSAVAPLDVNGAASSFYELRKLEIADTSIPSGWRRLRKVDLDVSHLYSTLIGKRYRYRMQGSGIAGSVDQLVLHPTPLAVETLRAYIIPSAPILVADGDKFNSVSAYEELVFQLAWRRCRDRQEQDLSACDREISRLTARISAASDGRDPEPFYLNPHGASGGPDDDLDWGIY